MNHDKRACRACGAEIFWATTAASRKPIPIDFKPNPEGNIVVRGTIAYVVDPEKENGIAERLYMPHHATCPKVKEFRK